MLKRFPLSSTLLVCLCLIAISASADITIAIPADPVAVGQIIDIGVSGIAPDMHREAKVGHMPDVGTYFRPVKGWNNQLAIVFMARVPGTYKVWVAAPLVTEASVKQGYAEAVIIVGGEPEPDPDPTPPTPPDPKPPPGKWRVVIVYESNDLDNLPPGQQSIIKSLTFREQLTKAGHQLVPGGVWDKDAPNRGGGVPKSLLPYLAACKSETLPRLCLSPVTGGMIRTFALPTSIDAALTLLEGAQP